MRPAVWVQFILLKYNRFECCHDKFLYALPMHRLSIQLKNEAVKHKKFAELCSGSFGTPYEKLTNLSVVMKRCFDWFTHLQSAWTAALTIHPLSHTRTGTPDNLTTLFVVCTQDIAPLPLLFVLVDNCERLVCSVGRVVLSGTNNYLMQLWCLSAIHAENIFI